MLLADLTASIRSFRIWNLLALQDIRQRYRRSVLGPFWNTLSLSVSIGALALVFTKIFNMPTEQYLTFLAVGFVFWTLLSTLLIESCATFTQAEGIIKQINLPLGVHVMRMVWRNLIVFVHHGVILVAVLIYMSVDPGPGILLLLPTLLLTAVTGVSLGYLLGGLCARYRDIAPIISSLVQVAFYVTPVIWQPALLRGHEELMTYNPLYHFIEILRAPVLGQRAAPLSWWASAAVAAGLAATALLAFPRFRKRVAYWL